MAQIHIGMIEDAKKNMQKALDQCPVNDDLNRSNILHNLGNMLLSEGHLERAFKIFEEVTEIANY